MLTPRHLPLLALTAGLLTACNPYAPAATVVALNDCFDASASLGRTVDCASAKAKGVTDTAGGFLRAAADRVGFTLPGVPQQDTYFAEGAPTEFETASESQDE